MAANVADPGRRRGVQVPDPENARRNPSKQFVQNTNVAVPERVLRKQNRVFGNRRMHKRPKLIYCARKPTEV